MSIDFTRFDRDIERQIQGYWNRTNARQSARRDSEQTLYFLDGPPNTSGKTHLGTVWNKVLKDVIMRTARSSGYDVIDRPGYDTHLFSTEQRIADANDIASADHISEIGIESFERECEAFEERNISELRSDFQDFGVWMDWERPYRTDAAEYADTAWQVFKRLYESGEVVEREGLSFACPECGLTLRKRSETEKRHLPFQDPPETSSNPFSLGYELAAEDGALVVGIDEPWHILCNTFLTVDPTRDYARVRTEEYGDLYVASERVRDVLPVRVRNSAEIVETVPGERFVKCRYEHPLLDPSVVDRPDTADCFRIVDDDSIVGTSGFGHGVPACDEQARQIAIERDLPVHEPLSDEGRFDDTVPDFDGMRIYPETEDVDAKVVQTIDDNGSFVVHHDPETYTKQCWLCGGPVTPEISSQWCIRLNDRRAALRDAVSAVDWIPEELEETMLSPDAWHPDWSRDARFSSDSDPNQDWLIEQDAYWGLPMPVWVAEDDPSDKIVLGSREEIVDRSDQSLTVEDIEPRRSVLDEITITEDDTVYHRVSSVFADRYTAAVAPMAVAGFGTDEGRNPDIWPVDLIVEAKDQPGLWFFMQLATGVPLFDEMPFKRAYEHGFLTDENGEKMSKSVGNIVTPDQALDNHAADAFRLYFVLNTSPGQDIALDWNEIESLEARLDEALEATGRAVELLEQDFGDEPSEFESIVNDWIQGRFETAVRSVSSDLEALRFASAADSALEFLVQTIVNTYLPLLRRLADEQRGLSQTTTEQLAYIIRSGAVLLSPFAPHFAECLYQHVGEEGGTVHAADWPLGFSPASEWKVDP